MLELFWSCNFCNDAWAQHTMEPDCQKPVFRVRSASLHPGFEISTLQIPGAISDGLSVVQHLGLLWHCSKPKRDCSQALRAKSKEWGELQRSVRMVARPCSVLGTPQTFPSWWPVTTMSVIPGKSKMQILVLQESTAQPSVFSSCLLRCSVSGIWVSIRLIELFILRMKWSIITQAFGQKWQVTKGQSMMSQTVPQEESWSISSLTLQREDSAQSWKMSCLRPYNECMWDCIWLQVCLWLAVTPRSSHSTWSTSVA